MADLRTAPRFVQDFTRWAEGKSGQNVERKLLNDESAGNGTETRTMIEQAMIEFYAEDIHGTEPEADVLIDWLCFEMGHPVPRPTSERPN